MAKSSKRGIHCRDESAAGSVVSLAVLLPIADRRIRFSASTNARRFASICECLVSSDMLRSRIWTCCLANSRERLAESRFLSIRSIFFTSPSPVPAVACRKAVPRLIASGPFIGSLRRFWRVEAQGGVGTLAAGHGLTSIRLLLQMAVETRHCGLLPFLARGASRDGHLSKSFKKKSCCKMR